MATQFLHGLETLEISDGIRPIQTVRSSVIGIIGTAPDADVEKFPLDVPVLVLNPRDAIDLGVEGTLPDALRAIQSRVWAWCIVVRVTEGATAPETMSNIIGDATQMTGVNAFLKNTSQISGVAPVGLKPRMLIAPGFTGARPTTGVAAINVGAGGSGYVQGTTTVTVAAAPAGGRTAKAHAVVVAGAVTSIVVDDPGFGYSSAPTITIAGAGTLATATATLGAVKNPVVAALLSLAPRFRATVWADGPGTTRGAAVTFASDWGSDRLYVIDPLAQVWDVATSAVVDGPASPHAVAQQAWLDNNRGFWWSASNQELLNVLGPSRPIDFRPNDPDCEANYLNEMKVATIVAYQGVRLWGNRSTSTDPIWSFLSVRRTADMIYESIEANMLWAIDRPISKNSLLEIQESVREYLRHLQINGAIVGGNAWVDPSINTPALLQAGHVHVDFDIEPAAPIERLTFRAHRNATYYEELVAQVQRAAA
ncbi:phage tail sheath C-terminal domain-containing protein [Chelatococcus asaccharovorans]|uniref:Phage tail protein n=1 Tax=Chelatococcus asaccharovorans TaxID=28210 RepID=A0A2V3UCK1_9HYPH|nr:phage tail sheath C-terminal domain-containing protein [Chelatococcus asaccharovorans]MBS7703328.1 phage tail sheath subtilisin-like domain-containing protein [Chelatococcus asaccharovorans]PXW61662.1 hypothetical protein C7450_103179 [Chelatococcus asaccharovorans]